VVNKLDEESLSKIIWKYGEERLHKKIAHGIVYFRYNLITRTYVFNEMFIDII
jgi:16S rRNA C1402 N4-methylase RsmH